MRKLTLCENISLDGVVQHSADDNHFPYPNWTGPYRSPEGLRLVTEEYGERYDLLLGRHTYDQWSNFWPKVTGNSMADRLNAATKHVVTHRPESLEWGPYVAVNPDLIEGVRSLKTQEGSDLILCGSSTLTSPLLEHGLVDEVLLVTYPVLLGTGKRFYAEGTPASTFELVSTKSTPTGVLINRYKVADPLLSS